MTCSRLLFVPLVILLLSATIIAAEPAGYYRWPTAYGNQLIFESEGNLWNVPLSGGIARRLTTASGIEARAVQHGLPGPVRRTAHGTRRRTAADHGRIEIKKG